MITWARSTSAFAEWGRLKVVAGIFVLFLATAVSLQWRNGAFQSEFADNPDEPSHYVNGLMIGDYIAQGAPSSPMKYAEEYYIHYPKVTLGHWPPLFYVIEGVWIDLFSPQRASVVLLMAFLTAGLALGASLVIWRELGAWIAVCTGLLLISLPFFQEISRCVNPEVLLGLFVLAAVLCYGRYLDSGDWRYSAAFGLLALFAVLTKGTGFALALLPVIGLVFARRPRRIFEWSFWAPAMIVAPLGAFWYLLAPGATHGSALPRGAVYSYYPWHQLFLWTPITLLEVVGAPIVVLIAVGMTSRVLIPWWRGAGIKGRWVALFAMVWAYWLFRAAVPPACPPKNWAAFVVPLLAFASAGASDVSNLGLFRSVAPRGKAVLAPILLLGILMFSAGRVSALPDHGFSEVAEMIVGHPDLEQARVVLVVSDAHGEGMLVAELAMRDARPGRIVLRSSKSLIQSGWFGKDRRALYENEDELEDYLRSIPVDAVVVDASPGMLGPEGLMIQRTIEQRPAVWRRVEDASRQGERVNRVRTLALYRRAKSEDLPRGRIRIDLKNRLGREIEIE